MNKTTIVFVHGLGGNPAATWGIFPDLVKADPELKDCETVFFGYPTSLFRLPFTNKYPKIQTLADALRTLLDVKYEDRKDFILVCHSLGGLIGRCYLVEEVKHETKLRVRGLLLYAVPNDGAGLAKVSSYVSWRHNQLRQLCRDSDLIRGLDSDWATTKIARRIKIRYIVGAMDRVVSEGSARSYWGNRNVDVVADRGHIELVKPKGADDMPYLILKQFVISLAPTTSEQIGAVRLGVEGMASKMDLAEVRAIVIKSQSVLRGLADQIKLLRAYKSLHDSLHIVKLQYSDLDAHATDMHVNPNAIHDFRANVDILEERNISINDAIQDLPAYPASIRQDEDEWAKLFNNAVTKARQAVKKKDPIKATQSVQDILPILRQQPSRIDGKLSQIAEAIEFSKLTELFLTAANLPELAEEAASLTEGKTSAEQLERKLKTQVNQHRAWQRIDTSMSGATEIMSRASAKKPWDFDALWKTIKEATQTLIVLDPTSTWATELSEIITKVDATREDVAITRNVDASGADNGWNELKNEFDLFCQRAVFRFLTVDSELKKLAGQVDGIGVPLRDLSTR